MPDKPAVDPSDDSLETFDTGCDSQLKFFDAPESYQFGQFVDLLVNYDGGLHQLTMPTAGSQNTTLGTDSQASVIALERSRRNSGPVNFPLHALGHLDRAVLPKPIADPQTVEVDPDAFLAHPAITLDGESIAVRLSDSAVRTVLARRPLLATVPGDGVPREFIVQMRPTADNPVALATDQLIVGDTAAFIANPTAPTTSGSVVRLQLSKKAIKTLRGGSAASIPVGDRNLTIIPSSLIASQNAMQTRDEGGASGVDRIQGTRTTTLNSLPVPSGRVPSQPSLEPGPRILPQDVIVPDREIPVTLFLPWEQVWTLKGYTRGRLVQSIGLGPLEETTIEIFSWDRRRRALEQTASAEAEQFGETTDTSRDASSVYNQLQTDKEFELQGGGGLKASYSYGSMLTIEANASISASNKEKLSQLSKSSQDRLQESVIRASTRVKTSRTTKITETAETGHEDRVTRRLKNPNRCMALTINYFDVHAAYDVTTAFLPDDARLCVLVRNPVNYSFVASDELVVRSHETVLRAALLDPALGAGFDGLRQVAARRLAKQLLDASDAERQQKEDEQSLKDGQGGSAGGSDEIAAATKVVVDALASVATAADKVNNADVNALMVAVDEHPESEWRGKMDSLGASAQRWLFKKLMLRAAQSLLNEAVSLIGIDKGTLLDHAPSLIAAINSNATLAPDSLLNPPPSDVDELLTPVIQQYTGNGFEWNWWWGFFKDNGLRRPDDAGLLGLLSSFRSTYSALLSAQQRTAALGGDSGGTGQQSQDRIDSLSSTDRLEMAFPVAETATSMERVDALMAHLKEFKNYYNYAILLGLPPVELLQRLSGSLNAQTISVGMFEPRVVAMRGNKVAIPLIVDTSKELQNLVSEIVAEVKKAKASTRRVTLPTAGLITDLRVGICSGCEKQVENERALELRALAARIALDELEGKRRQARLDAKELGPTEIPSSSFTVRLERTPEPTP